MFEFGGAFGVTQYRPPPIIVFDPEKGEPTIIYPDYGSYLSFAGKFGFYWTLPTSFNSMFSFILNHGSGYISEDIGPFTPITTSYYGEIFKAELPGLTAFSLNFAGRFHRTFGANASLSYFVLNSLKTANNFALDTEENSDRLLGAELFFKFTWSPFSDLQLTFGAGTFMPSLGNVWRDGKPHWRVDLAAVLAIY